MSRVAAASRRADPRVPARACRRRCPRGCKYHPSCSAYAVQAIESYGILRGAVLACWRLLRCNPFSRRGSAPQRSQTIWSSFLSHFGGSKADLMGVIGSFLGVSGM